MLRKATGLLIASLLVSTSSFAAVLDGDDFVSATSVSGRANDWSLTFFSIASQANMKPGKSTTENRSIDTYDYFSINYKLGNDQKASLRLPFNYNTAGTDEYGENQTSNFAMQDIHFVYSNYDLGYIDEVNLSGKVKLYLPTSKVAQETGLITKVRFEGYADYSFNRSWSMAYIAKPDIYWQSQTASINTSIPTFDDGMYVTDPRQTNKQFGLEHYVQVQYYLNQIFQFTTKTGFVENWYHSSPVEGLDGDHTTALRLAVGMWIKPARGFSFTLGVSNDSMLGSYRGEDTKIWQPFNTQYSLMTNIYVM
jgi:hypothetical protein